MGILKALAVLSLGTACALEVPESNAPSDLSTSEFLDGDLKATLIPQNGDEDSLSGEGNGLGELNVSGTPSMVQQTPETPSSESSESLSFSEGGANFGDGAVLGQLLEGESLGNFFQAFNAGAAADNPGDQPKNEPANGGENQAGPKPKENPASEPGKAPEDVE